MPTRRLPWMPFFAADFWGSARVLAMTPAERDAYLWLLCAQWTEGPLPFDAQALVPRLPRNVDEGAMARVLAEFFPPDPDTNLRENPRLAELQAQQATTKKARAVAAANARAARARKSKQDNAVSSDQNATSASAGATTSAVTRRKNQNQREETTPTGVVVGDAAGAAPAAATATPIGDPDEQAVLARLGERLQSCDDADRAAFRQVVRAAKHPIVLAGELLALIDGPPGTSTPTPPATVARALRELLANGEQFNVARLRGYLRKRAMPTAPAGSAWATPAIQLRDLAVDAAVTHG